MLRLSQGYVSELTNTSHFNITKERNITKKSQRNKTRNKRTNKTKKSQRNKTRNKQTNKTKKSQRKKHHKKLNNKKKQVFNKTTQSLQK